MFIQVFMAELLKKYYPRYVELHNYCQGNSLAKKIDNWRTLNRKVLSKLNLKLNDKTIHEITTCQDKAIENFLSRVKNKIIKDCNDERASLYSIDDRDIDRVNSILDFDEVQNKVMPKGAFLRLNQELQDKNELIGILNNKIAHLQQLLELKDRKINDLSAQMTKLNFSLGNKTR
ncbi:sperm flagellar protein 1-like [Microplitis demolitor]|uniref:sperm flagellar protein 1-like n=1 Tax=Microplitis demolitor TaxID=69319 RepID=UPI00235B69F3|nr:sperm flagellar protein 1-like [Microplitis demolitor]